MTDDWRLTDQHNYLDGIELEYRQYAPTNESDHEHCEFCWAKFMLSDGPEMLREGYATLDGDSWICQTCYNDFNIEFHWKLASPRR